jgi:hypothetical protein
MLVRSLAVVALLALGTFAGPATLPAAAQTAATLSTDELMRATALDEIFSQFGPSIEAAPAEQGVPFTGPMFAAWTGAVREVFDADRMHNALAAALEDKFSDEDYAAYAEFFRSDFGVKVSNIEREVTVLPPEGQLAAREAGIGLASASAGSRRSEQVEEMLRLVSADIATSMIRQSVRGMLIGMSMNGQQGDIEVPWEEIDAHLTAIMPDIEADVALTQRAMMYFAYNDLSEAELDTYLAFLRTESAQKFYAVAAYSIGELIAERMEAFGETLSRKLAQVNV